MHRSALLVVQLLLLLLRQCSADVLVYNVINSPMVVREYRDLPANFGPTLPEDGLQVYALKGIPADGCSPLNQPPAHSITANLTIGFAVIVARGGENCTFLTKVRNAQLAGYRAVIVHNVHSNNLEPMSAKDAGDIHIPSVFVGEQCGNELITSFQYPHYMLVLNDELPFDFNARLILPFALIVGFCFVVMMGVVVTRCVNDQRRLRRNRLPRGALRAIPIVRFQKATMPYETCCICLDDYEDGDKLRVLPCSHAYHSKCIDEWLTKSSRACPICKRKVLMRRRRNQRTPQATNAADAAEIHAARDLAARITAAVRSGGAPPPPMPPMPPTEESSDSDVDDDSRPLLNPVQNSALTGANHGTFSQPRGNPFDRSPNLPPSILAADAPDRSASRFAWISLLFRRSARTGSAAAAQQAAPATAVADTEAGSSAPGAEQEELRTVQEHLRTILTMLGPADGDSDEEYADALGADSLQRTSIYEPVGAGASQSLPSSLGAAASGTSASGGRLGVVALPNLDFCPPSAADRKPPNDFIV